MPDHETALQVYNRVISACDDLCVEGDGSSGERLSIYKIVAPDAVPRAFDSWDSFFDAAVAKGYVEDPRKCWTLIRISAHGTIEFRMFGATVSVAQIESWARRCYNLCVDAAKC